MTLALFVAWWGANPALERKALRLYIRSTSALQLRASISPFT